MGFRALILSLAFALGVPSAFAEGEAPLTGLYRANLPLKTRAELNLAGKLFVPLADGVNLYLQTKGTYLATESVKAASLVVGRGVALAGPTMAKGRAKLLDVITFFKLNPELTELVKLPDVEEIHLIQGRDSKNGVLGLFPREQTTRSYLFFKTKSGNPPDLSSLVHSGPESSLVKRLGGFTRVENPGLEKIRLKTSFAGVDSPLIWEATVAEVLEKKPIPLGVKQGWRAFIRDEAHLYAVAQSLSGGDPEYVNLIREVIRDNPEYVDQAHRSPWLRKLWNRMSGNNHVNIEMSYIDLRGNEIPMGTVGTGGHARKLLKLRTLKDLPKFIGSAFQYPGKGSPLPVRTLHEGQFWYCWRDKLNNFVQGLSGLANQPGLRR